MKHHKKSDKSILCVITTELKIILFLGFLISIGTIITSCEKENTVDANEYYVKYEVNSTTIYSGGKLNVTINTETNELMTLSINQRKLSEIVIGPVKKGFIASMIVAASGETHDRLKLYATIFVSKNGSPFALKKNDGSDEPRDSVELDYTIDY